MVIWATEIKILALLYNSETVRIVTIPAIIEPQRRCVDRPFVEPRQRQGTQLSNLPSGHCLDGSSEGQGPARLHFDDDQSVAIACDEIDFSDPL